MLISSARKRIERASWTDVLYARDLLRALLVRDIQSRYKDSRFGLAWAVIHPLLYLLIFYFLFKLVFSLNIQRYSSFAFTGVLVWTWFQSSVLQSVAVVQNNRDLIRQPGFPASLLPTVTVSANLVNFLIALPVLMLFLLYERPSAGWELLALPALIVVQFLFILSITYFASALNVLFRDTQHILTVMLQLLFFMTPIFYNLEAIPAGYRWIIGLNPLSHLIAAYRAVLVDGAWPQSYSVLIPCVCALIALPLGYAYFKRESTRFLEEL